MSPASPDFTTVVIVLKPGLALRVDLGAGRPGVGTGSGLKKIRKVKTRSDSVKNPIVIR